MAAPLNLAAERMLGGTARRLSRATKGFDADTTAALEEVTAFFTMAGASKGGGLYRSAIVAQLAEVARRIQDGVPAVAEGPGIRRDRRPGRFAQLGQP
ncbi:hypothetical protein [Streptomyces sp. NPDC101165]|uniref:hypothetical protein n=1 Tax=Streptomyces sp. NPDC101165 TaxID=3366119 RepID=UPI00380B8924